MFNVGCGLQETILPTPVSTASPPPTVIQSSQEQYYKAWGLSSHARSLDTPSNKNNTVEDISVAGCNSCHRMNDSVAYPGLAWLNPTSGVYETVADNGELCGKCHPEQWMIENNPISSMAHRGFQCTTCHDPHSLKSGCTNSACHSNLIEKLYYVNQLAVPPGHEFMSNHQCNGGCHMVATQVAEQPELVHMGSQHIWLTCSACHDAAQLITGPVANEKWWTTFMDLPADEQDKPVPVYSHALQRAVNCSKCHYPGNPWHLLETVTLDQLHQPPVISPKPASETPVPEVIINRVYIIIVH